MPSKTARTSSEVHTTGQTAGQQELTAPAGFMSTGALADMVT